MSPPGPTRNRRHSRKESVTAGVSGSITDDAAPRRKLDDLRAVLEKVLPKAERLELAKRLSSEIDEDEVPMALLQG